MADTYPYVLVNGKIGALFAAIQSAAKPPKFGYEFLSKLGFSSSNDRAFVTLFRHLGLTTENNIPNSHFDEIRDPARFPYALGESIRSAYADLFAINTNIHKASDADIKSAISRVTGKESEYVNRAFNTFKSLLSLAKFDGGPKAAEVEPAKATPTSTTTDNAGADAPAPDNSHGLRAPHRASLNYNIEIHLPATTDISVYNAIFKSLRDTLGVV